MEGQDMTDYNELVKALRERARRENEWYEHGGDIIEAAAAAIEALQAEVDTLKRTDIKRCQECLYLGQPVGEQLLPKLGEWVRVREVDIPGEMHPVAFKCMCSKCRNEYVFPRIPQYCPDCGSWNTAKKEVQDA